MNISATVDGCWIRFGNYTGRGHQGDFSYGPISFDFRIKTGSQTECFIKQKSYRQTMLQTDYTKFVPFAFFKAIAKNVERDELGNVVHVDREITKVKFHKGGTHLKSKRTVLQR